MKNVRHDCLLNHSSVVLTLSTATRTVLPIPRFPSGSFWLLPPRDGIFFLCVYCLPTLPCLLTNCSSGCFCRAERALGMEQYSMARRVHISTFLPWWIKSIGSDNAHPEQTLTCFSTLLQTKPPAVKKSIGLKGKNNNICKGLWTRFIYDFFCLPCLFEFWLLQKH